MVGNTPDHSFNLNSQLSGLNINTGSAAHDARSETRATSPVPSAWNAGQEASFTASGAAAAGSGPSSVPEQKIFPGIVHERARRGSMMTNASTAGEMPKLTRDNEEHAFDGDESAMAYDYGFETDDD